MPIATDMQVASRGEGRSAAEPSCSTHLDRKLTYEKVNFQMKKSPQTN
jgi:hypothetical protein